MTDLKDKKSIAELVQEAERLFSASENAGELANIEARKRNLSKIAEEQSREVEKGIKCIKLAMKYGLSFDLESLLMEEKISNRLSKLWLKAINELDEKSGEEFKKECANWSADVQTRINVIWSQACVEMRLKFQNSLQTLELLNKLEDLNIDKGSVDLLFRSGNEAYPIDVLTPHRWENAIFSLREVETLVLEIEDIPDYVRSFLVKAGQDGISLASYVSEEFALTRQWIDQNPDTLQKLVIKWSKLAS